MTTDTTRARPCPFCGGINIVHCGHHMYCHACGAEGPDADSQHETEAIAAWNRRAPTAQPAVDALAEAEYFIDNPSAWSNFDQRASDAIAAVCKAFRAAHATADSAAAPAGGAVAGPGWKLVPVEPTPEMLRAGDQKTWVLPALDCWRAMLAAAPTPPAQAADSVLEDAARLERERICAAIKAEDDYCVDHGDYMLDSDDCIKIVRGEWVRPDFSVAAARKQGANHD